MEPVFDYDVLLDVDYNIQCEIIDSSYINFNYSEIHLFTVKCHAYLKHFMS